MPIPLRILLLALVVCACDKNAGDTNEPAANIPTREHSAPEPSAPSVVPDQTASERQAGYVGSQACAGCHSSQYKIWQGSHHDLAMQDAKAETILGDFDNAEFDYFGTVSRFYTRNNQYFVRTDGPDGELHDYPIAYTFGVYPLQQYLVEFPDGKLQALSIAWDSRPHSEGGQRWYHLHPDEHIRHGDELHWTGLNFNWNFMCADCHSTNLQKNYDRVSETFATQWSEINVACEACHGPGERHVQWAQRPVPGVTDKGLDVSFSARKQAAWNMDSETGIARLAQAADTQKEIETCAQCHARRSTSFPHAKAGAPFLDHFNLSLLDESLYHADGQIDDEVYVYGSFLQSKMHAAGVSCSNCHNPHSLELRVEGNGLCAQCHLPSKFDTAQHHFHPADTAGSQCINCHMPSKTYMGVDARRDHSFRIPRPDLSDNLETPNSCIGCHTEKPNSWAAAVLEEKFGKPKESHFGEAIYAGRHGLLGAEEKLMALAADESQPPIARATAINLLPRYLSQQSAQLLQVIAQGDAPLLNLGLAKSLETIPAQYRPAFAIPLLYDEQRVTAALAANAMAGAQVEQYPAEVRRRLSVGLSDYVASQQFNADRPESLVNLAGMYVEQGEIARGERLFRSAIKLAPSFTPAYINLADLYRATGREAESESILREAMETNATQSPLQHALGLSLVRQKRMDEAVEYLRRAAESDATSPRYVYVYGIALNSTGNPKQAIAALERGLEQFPRNPQIISALISISQETGDQKAAEKYRDLISG